MVTVNCTMFTVNCSLYGLQANCCHKGKDLIKYIISYLARFIWLLFDTFPLIKVMGMEIKGWILSGSEIIYNQMNKKKNKKNTLFLFTLKNQYDVVYLLLLIVSFPLIKVLHQSPWLKAVR